MNNSFIDKCLQGLALSTDIDDAVEMWHKGDGGEVDLPEYLGMTEEEYAVWVRDPDILDILLFAKKRHIPLMDAINVLRRDDQEFGLAARATSLDEAAKLLHWLRRHQVS